MAFRYSGTAWDGQKWVAAPAIKTFGLQIEEIRPGTFAADGTVASKTHDQNSPNSDHTVWPKTGSGVVYAIDVTEAGGLSIDELAEAIRLSKDPRCKYFIHDKRMFSSYAAHGIAPWTWRSYSGYNAHIGHGHLSIHHTASLANSTKPWDIGEGTMSKELVMNIQKAINATAVTPKLVVDGIWGLQTHNRMVAAFNLGAGVPGPKGDPGTPGKAGAPGKDGKDGKDATLTIKGDVTIP